jgi:Xaa-Pro aminopeptidase
MNKDATRIFVSDPLLVCWLLNIRGRDVEHTPVLNALALITRQGTVSVFVDLAKITPTLKRAVGAKINFYALDDVLKHATNRQDTIQIDPVQCPLAIKQALDKAKISVVMADDPCLLLRAVKNKTEIKGAVEAHKKDAVAFKKFLAWFKKQDFVKTKITELDIVEKLRSFRAQDPDYIEDSFKTIAGYGSNGAVIHYKPTVKTNKVLRSGSLLLLDSGAQYRCGTTDITRVLPIGKPTPHMKACYQAVWKGLHQLQNTRFVYGTSGYQLDVIARKEVWQMGDDYGHGTGHGVGSFLSVHEGPQRFSTTTILQPGMILSIEPGLYYEGKFGIRLENLVVVEEDKRKGDVKRMLRFRLLTQVPFEKEML